MLELGRLSPAQRRTGVEDLQPLISRMRKQSALTQWQTRTTAECRTTTRGTATGRAEDAEGMDAMAIVFAEGGELIRYGCAGRKSRQAREALKIFLGGRRIGRATGAPAEGKLLSIIGLWPLALRFRVLP